LGGAGEEGEGHEQNDRQPSTRHDVLLSPECRGTAAEPLSVY
jgi:hypothetical protein